MRGSQNPLLIRLQTDHGLLELLVPVPVSEHGLPRAQTNSCMQTDLFLCHAGTVRGAVPNMDVGVCEASVAKRGRQSDKFLIMYCAADQWAWCATYDDGNSRIWPEQPISVSPHFASAAATVTRVINCNQRRGLSSDRSILAFKFPSENCAQDLAVEGYRTWPSGLLLGRRLARLRGFTKI